MTKKAYVGIDDICASIPSMYIGIDNIACSITKAYVGDENGIARLFFEKNVENLDFLIDFEYIDNNDGTYTLTAWKGTLNGEPSTEIVIPDMKCIVL